MPILKRFSRLQAVSLFDDYSHAADVPDFARYNLVYGFNGTGKTTLSRLLRHLEAGALPPDWPTNARFCIELDDGTSVSQTANVEVLKEKVSVVECFETVERVNDWRVRVRLG